MNVDAAVNYDVGAFDDVVEALGSAVEKERGSGGTLTTRGAILNHGGMCAMSISSLSLV